VHPSTSLIRLGFVGLGNVLGAYLPLLERLERNGSARLTVLCGRERQRATFESTHPTAVFLTNYTALLERDDVDAVVVLTPMAEHGRMARAALESGKHVLVEKPMAVDLDEARALIDLARSSSGRLLCAPFTLLSPTCQAIGRRIAQGDIGRVVSARGRYGWAGPDWTDWFYRPGGGALFDLGVYNLTTLTGWLGPIRRVTALAGIAVPERQVGEHAVRVEVEDNFQLAIEFATGALATITTGFSIQQYRGPGLEVFGTEGTVNLLGDDWDPNGYELWRNSAGCWQCFNETHPDWPWTDGLRHLVECIQEGTKPIVTPEHAFHVLDVLVQTLASAREGRARSVESTFAPMDFMGGGAVTGAHRVHDRTRPVD
jgi:predicted dehydrogenase